jgi:hypothetical protein
MRKTNWFLLIVSLIFLGFVPLTILPVCYGQNLSGMAGAVTDQTGAGIPGAVITLTNPTTGAKFTQATGETGFYRFSEIPPGEGYSAVFTAKGFAPLEIKGIYLTVGTIRTQNASLTISASAEQVEVTATNSEVTIDTTSATIGNTFDVGALNLLPVQQRNDPTALFKLQPGVTDTGAVTGARVDQNYVTVDGLDVNDFATGSATQNNTGAGVFSGFQGSIVGHAPIDSVEEFHGTVGGEGADTGATSGGQFALVTKSGTNHFHGNLNEYHRDPSLVANSWFANNAVPQVPRNHLIENQFGGNIGGPIKHDKAFFFFDYNDSRTIRSVLTQRTVPLDSLRNGNIGFINAASTPSSPSITYLTPAQVKGFDSAGIGEDTTWIGGFDSRFPHSNNQSTGDLVNSGGYAFNAPDDDYETDYVGRVDYTINSNMSAFAKFNFTRENATNAVNEFAGDPATDPLVDRSYSFALGHNWTLGGNKINRVFLGEVVQKLSFPNAYNPDGSTFFTFSDGTGPALASSLYLTPNAQARRIPIPMVGDDFSWTKGVHTLQFGGTFKNILAHTTNVADFNETEIGPGGLMLALCGPTTNDCAIGSKNAGKDSTLRPPSIYLAPANATAAQAGLQNSAIYDWDQAFLYMLGHIAVVNSDYNYTKAGQALPWLTGDQRMYRYYQMQLYGQDSWKITPSLTISLGATYRWYSVPYETRGLESTEPFTLNNYLKARVEQSSQSQTGPTAVPLIAYYLGGKGNGGNAPGLIQPEYKLATPHVGFAWNPGFDKKMVINASGSVVYDRTVINAVQAIQDGDSYLFQQTAPFPQGISGDPWDSVRTDPRLDANNNISKVKLSAPASPKAPYEPFSSSSYCASHGWSFAPCGLALGNAFNATIDPSLKTPYSIIFNAGIQRQIPWDMVLKASYAGRLGRRLLGQGDANQVLEFPDPKSGQLLSQAFGNVTEQLRAGATVATVKPQPWFEDVIGKGYTSFLVANFGPFVQRGDFGDSVQFFADTGAPLNVGSAAQYSENTFYSNQGFSTYHALLLTLQKNMSHGLHYDANYTYSHSTDNTSFFANSAGDTGIGGIGLICDLIRPRECRANSDFDVRHYITGDATYELPFGRNQPFLATQPHWVNEIVGDWSLSGVTEWHTGNPWSTNSNAFVASYSNDAPGILIGPKSAVSEHLLKTPGEGVSDFKNSVDAAGAFEGPIGFKIGPRNGLLGPGFFNADLGLAKTFPIYGEKVNLKFRADSFNTFNHPNFTVPSENVYNGLDQQDITSSTFGDISYTVEPDGNLNNGARVLQLSLRLEF